jgi:hypothetical protein
MLTTIFTRLRSVFQPQFMRNIDQYLLTHHPLVWETRVHWFTLYATALLLLLVGAAFCVPISFPNEIAIFDSINFGLEIVEVFAIGIIGLFFSLLVNGMFARFFKTGVIATNQKYKPLDFFKLGGIYGFMLVFAAIACSAYHYTLIIRTHCIINQKENYALLDKYAKLYEFYQQDTLKIKGFEVIKPYINERNLGYSRLGENRYHNFPTDFFGIDHAPVNQALYTILPENKDFYKMKKDTLEAIPVKIKKYMVDESNFDHLSEEAREQALVDAYAAAMEVAKVEEEQNRKEKYEYHDFEYKILRLSSDSIQSNLNHQTLGIELQPLYDKIQNYCTFTHYTTPHTKLNDGNKKIIDTEYSKTDSITIQIVKKEIDNTHYAAENKYTTFWKHQFIEIGMTMLLFVLLFLSLHAYRSYRFVSLLPFAAPFTLFVIAEFITKRENPDVLLECFVFSYITFALSTVFWHRKAYMTNPLKFGIIFSVFCILFCAISFPFTPNLLAFQEKLDHAAVTNSQNTTLKTLFIAHILCYACLLLFRNTRLVILTPFLYFVAFIWIILPDILKINHYDTNHLKEIGIKVEFTEKGKNAFLGYKKGIISGECAVSDWRQKKLA